MKDGIAGALTSCHREPNLRGFGLQITVVVIKTSEVSGRSLVYLGIALCLIALYWMYNCTVSINYDGESLLYRLMVLLNLVNQWFSN